MICAFDHGSLVKDVVNRIEGNNIDEKSVVLSLSLASCYTALLLLCRKLVQYCVLKGYLRRVRDYRISLDDTLGLDNANGQANSDGRENGLATKVKGKKSLKELCDGTNDSDSLACLGHRKCLRDECSSLKSSSSPILVSHARALPSARKPQSSSIDSYLTLWK